MTASQTAQEQYNETERQLAAIESQVRQQPLTSDLLPISALLQYYSNNSDDNNTSIYFQRGVKYLSDVSSSNAVGYTHFRKVRGDGNCYYRSFLYSVCETCLSGAVPLENVLKFQNRVKQSINDVCKYGYDRDSIEMFYEELEDLVGLIVEVRDGNKIHELHARLNEENGSSEYCTWYLRVVTAAYLKSDPDRFMLFLDSHDQSNNEIPISDISTFCAREVEPMGKECGMVQVIALAEALGVRVNVEYLDGRPFKDKLMMYKFGPDPNSEDNFLEISLLYRPGHYDILYKLESV